MTRDSVLALRGISKRFGLLDALTDVDVDFRAGEVHGLLGENGAGKSTLMNIVFGLLPPDAGTIRLDGSPVCFERPGAAQRAGIGMVHQEFALVDALSVAENLALALHPAGGLRCDLNAVMAAATRLAAEIGLEIGDLTHPAGALPVGVRQRVEILKALAGDMRVLILDEPTSVLTPGETAHLFRVLDRLRSRGVAVIFITHKLREVTMIADRVTVLRRGRVVATLPRSEVDEEVLAQMMIGTTLAPRQRPRRSSAVLQAPLLGIAGLSIHLPSAEAKLHEVDLEVAHGEVLGIAGVDGNGQSELFEILAGLRAPTSGTIHVNGRTFSRLDPGAAIAAGIGHIPPDRQRQGLVMKASVRDNAVLSSALLRRLSRGPFLPVAGLRAMAQQLIAGYSIRVDSQDAPVATLSGGNQQRLVVARTLALEPKVLVAFNPTRGLDIVAARSVYEAIEQAVARGTAVLLISTDLDEVIELSDRVSVLYRGRLSEPLLPPFPVERLGRMMTGLDEQRTTGAEERPEPPW
jgi:simple sugar transport system ATP-binding protein